MRCNNCNLYTHSAPSCIEGTCVGKKKKPRIMVINSLANDRDEANRIATPDKSLLDKMEGLDFYYTNAIKCRTPKGTKIKVSEIKKCQEHLLKEIEKYKPEYVMILGSQALKMLSNEGITSICGVPKKHEKYGFKFIASYSPSVVAYDPTKAQFVDQAFNNFKAMVKGKEHELPELNIKLITSMKELNQAFKYLREEGYNRVSYDIETRGLDRFNNDITLFGFGNTQVQYILPLEVKYSPLRGKPIAQRRLAKSLIKRLNSEMKERIAQNGKFDDNFLKEKYGIKPIITFDTLLASHCLDENTPNGLKENALLHCNAKDWDINKKLKTGNVETKSDFEDYVRYLGYDIYYTFALYKIFNKRLKRDESLYKLFHHLYIPASKAYEDVQFKGIYVNQEKFKEVEKYLRSELDKIETGLKKYTNGQDINWSSPKQVGEFLYDTLGLPVIEVTDSGAPATGESVLLRLRDKHPAVELLLQHRGVHIQISHFIDGWLNRMHNHRLYPNFKLHGTVTGRTSSNNPNLQQVPRDKKIRSLLGPSPGRVFIEADLSQAELRIAAMMADEDNMKFIYQTGGDIHDSTYNIISGEDINDEKDPAVKKEKRKKAKAVNFGFLYGMQWKKFKDYGRDNYGLKLTDEEAKTYRRNFFNKYPKLLTWHDKQRKIVKANGEVRSPIGRIRRLPDIYSSDRSKAAEAERQCINSPVQGFGSDITLLGLCEITGYAKYVNPEYVLDKSKFDVLGSVHDSILFEVDKDYVEELAWKVKSIVENNKVLKKVFKFTPTVPIIMDISVGYSWGGCVELDFKGDWKSQIRKVLTDE
ncbi:DNA polymerase I [Clostridium phage CP3]|nr:DNA polymerase I [Clostridium phage CP3]